MTPSDHPPLPFPRHPRPPSATVPSSRSADPESATDSSGRRWSHVAHRFSGGGADRRRVAVAVRRLSAHVPLRVVLVPAPAHPPGPHQLPHLWPPSQPPLRRAPTHHGHARPRPGGDGCHSGGCNAPVRSVIRGSRIVSVVLTVRSCDVDIAAAASRVGFGKLCQYDQQFPIRLPRSAV